MTPSNYRAGGSQTNIRFAVGECSLGSILVAQSDRGICAILLGDDPDSLARDLQDQFPQANLIGGNASFEQLFPSMSAERPSSNAFGNRCDKFPWARQRATRTSQNSSALQSRYALA